MDSWLPLPTNPPPTTETCAFCGEAGDSTRRLITSPTSTCICGECVVFAYRVLEASGDLPNDAEADEGPVFIDETTGVHEIVDARRS